MAYVITEDGEANFVGVAEEKGWVARIQFNGEFSTAAQEKLARQMVFGLRFDLLWTFRYDGADLDFGSNYQTRADCIEAADKWYDEKIMSEEGSLSNGESFDDVVELVEFFIPDNAYEEVIVTREEYTVEYVHYHGDDAEHGTY